MGKKLTVGLLPITNKIVVGKLNKAGNMWAEKQDMTDDIINAIVELLQKRSIFYERDGREYELKEVEIKKEDKI